MHTESPYLSSHPALYSIPCPQQRLLIWVEGQVGTARAQARKGHENTASLGTPYGKQGEAGRRGFPWVENTP